MQHALEKAVTPRDDNSKPDLFFVWNALQTPIYDVVDEQGMQHNEAEARRLSQCSWIYGDTKDGFYVLREHEAWKLILIPQETHNA